MAGGGNDTGDRGNRGISEAGGNGGSGGSGQPISDTGKGVGRVQLAAYTNENRPASQRKLGRVQRRVMRHTARPAPSLAGFGPDHSPTLARFQEVRTLAIALALLAGGCSGGGGAGAPITPSNGGVSSLADAQSRTSIQTLLPSFAQDQQRGPIALLREFRPIGGLGNVVPGSPELALAPLNFAPNTNGGLISGPNPRTISNVIAGGTDSKGDNGETTDPTLSAWLYAFGQFVDHDLDLEETPLTSAPINVIVPAGDPVFTAGTVIAMTRATRSSSTNTLINTTAGYLDLSQLYGSDTATASSLVNPDGTLRTSGNGMYLPVANDQYVGGDPRVMENPELTVVTTLFMREHNHWVQTLKSQHPNWTSSQLYGMAKAITTAEYENIIYTEYLPDLLGPILGGYEGFNPSVNARRSPKSFRPPLSELGIPKSQIPKKDSATRAPRSSPSPSPSRFTTRQRSTSPMALTRYYAPLARITLRQPIRSWSRRCETC